jgi:hypothetical protein
LHLMWSDSILAANVIAVVMHRGSMEEYQLGGGLRLATAVEKTHAFSRFLHTRMARALETEDPQSYIISLLSSMTIIHSSGAITKSFRKIVETA